MAKKKYEVNKKYSDRVCMTPFGVFKLSENISQAKLKKLRDFGYEKEILVIDVEDTNG